MSFETDFVHEVGDQLAIDLLMILVYVFARHLLRDLEMLWMRDQVGRLVSDSWRVPSYYLDLVIAIVIAISTESQNCLTPMHLQIDEPYDSGSIDSNSPDFVATKRLIGGVFLLCGG